MKARTLINLAIATTLMRISVEAGQQITINDSELDRRVLGIPVDIRDQQTFVGLGKTTWWMVTLILPNEHYSKNNLERIFQYYSEKYVNKKDILRVSVFADEETYKRSQESWHRSNDRSGEAVRNLPSKQKWSIPHATYERLCYNEFYYYSPDPENPDKRETIVLKGKSQTLTVIPDDCN